MIYLYLSAAVARIIGGLYAWAKIQGSRGLIADYAIVLEAIIDSTSAKSSATKPPKN